MTDLPPPRSSSSPPAGWYPDERLPGYYRWWDGARWTDAVQNVQFTPPAGPPTGSPEAPSLLPPPPPRFEQSPSSGYAPSLGAAYAPMPMYGAAPATSRNAVAIWSLILASLGVLMAWLPFVGLGLAVLALILGVVGIRRAPGSGSGRGLAISGTVVGGFMTVVGLVYSLSFAAYLAGGGTSDATPVTQPSAIESPAPDDPGGADESADDTAEFVVMSRNDLEDFGKDLDDMVVTLDEDGFWRLLSNSVELSFNYGQLASRTPPAAIAAEWGQELTVLEDHITHIDEAIQDERYDELREIIGDAQDQLAVLGGILDDAQ